MYEVRDYRVHQKSEGLVTYQVQIAESDLMISSDKNLHNEILIILKELRKRVKDACDSINDFRDSLVPLYVNSNDIMIQQMIDASIKANVGPMAAIAGTISEYIVKELSSKGITCEIIVENGGDIFINSKIDRKVMVFAGKSVFSNKLGIILRKELMPIGICTSAGTIGHSKSFGKADAVVVISKDNALADAMATSIGNIVKSENDISEAIEFGKNIEGVLGILIIIGEKMGVWGEVELFKP